jgi:translation initiation factor IF-3
VALSEALRLAQERKLDLVEIAPMAQPPVCKIIGFKKFLYQENKKERGSKSRSSETKNVRITYAIATHDLKHNAQKAAKFLTQGHKVNGEMKIRGREWAHENLAREKIRIFLEHVQKTHSTAKIEGGVKRMWPRALLFSVVK